MGSSTLDWITYIATAIAVFISVFYFYAKYKLSYWSRKGVKSPPAHIIFGNMKDSILFKKAPGEVLRDIYNSVDADEPFVGCYFFHKPSLILRSSELIKQLMIKDFDIFSNRGFGGELEVDSIGYVGLLGIRNPKWKYLRTKMTPTLTGQKLRNILPLIVDSSKNLMEHLESEKPNDEGVKSFKLINLAGKYCTDVFASFAFGVTTNSFDETNTLFWKAGGEVTLGWKRGIILILNFFFPELVKLTTLVSKGPAKFFRDLFWDSYNTREQIGNKRGDLIDSLILLKNGPQNPDFVFEGDNLVAQSVAFYVAGHEATSTAIAFTLYELSQHPEYEERVYEEIQKIMGSEELTMDMLNQMTFMEKCINESLRLHPPLPMTDRICSQDYNIPGTDITLEKGSTVYLAVAGTNMDPKYFKEPEKFDPLRTDSENLGFSTAHVTFGIGPRSCIGQRIGIFITKIALITVLQKHSLVQQSSVDPSLNAVTIFTTPVDGLPLLMRKRN